MNIFDLSGKTALVIGGNGVLGSSMASALVQHGAKVAIAGRDMAKADEVVQSLAQHGEAKAYSVDVTKREDIAALLQAVTDWSPRIDILVNCAGRNSNKPFFEVTEEDWDSIMAVNAKSVFLTSQIIGKHMLDAGGGSIINISSVSSDPPLSGVFAYSASKAAVNNMTKFLAREFSPTVRVNAIIPGFFPAEQNRKILTKARVDAILNHTPLGRLGEAEELQGTLIWLASDQAASFVTGELVRVDGGFGAITI
ncbi:SDR family oxidoreductase [Alicyclobacillus fodiniaquatilis]|jgi:NAD(P)-dependent dehydrogenase (short-subunit alcohol dehydrogenase family)|uniref:SDR family oxidoreductase n=1 Tax=Alicyclobacillus fodiniaquatilis TaxID=1661150 RepID=A0ABW4JI10_9BACL